MKPSEVLKTYGWGQGHLAQNKDGHEVVCPTNKDELKEMDKLEGVCFCAMGAFHACGIERKFPIFSDDLADEGIIPEGLVNWNDEEGRTKEEVVELLEKYGY